MTKGGKRALAWHRLAPVAILSIAGCQPGGEGQRLAAASCRSLSAIDEAAVSAVPTWTRKLVDVEPKGVYTFRHPLDTKATAPTELRIARDLNLQPGDYVGLQAQGRWYWGENTGPDGPTSQRLGGVFVDGRGRKLAPGKSGQESRFETPPTYWGSQPTDIPEDFAIPPDAETIMRVPAGATKLLFSVGDSAYGDNSTAPNFGVMVFEPNRKSAEPVVTAASSQSEAEGDLFSAIWPTVKETADPPVATGFSAGPFAGPDSAETRPQWRANYAGNGWKPDRSKYDAPRDSSRHWGWDIFSPAGAELVAPAWPSYMDVPPQSASYGNTVVFSFKSGGRVWRIAYAHLGAIVGGARSISGPEVVARSGCTGSAVDQTGCGKRYEVGPAKGMRNDHVHVGLFQHPATNANDQYACDPKRFLNWTIR